MIDWSGYKITDKEIYNYNKILTYARNIPSMPEWKGLGEFDDYKPGFLFFTKKCWLSDNHLPYSYRNYIDQTYILSCHFYKEHPIHEIIYSPSTWNTKSNNEICWTSSTVYSKHRILLSDSSVLEWCIECIEKEKKRFTETIDIITSMEKPLQTYYKLMEQARKYLEKYEQIMIKKINIQKDSME